MISYKNEIEYTSRVLNLLGNDYKNHLKGGSNQIDDVRLRFMVFQCYFNNVPEKDVAKRIKEKFPFIKEDPKDEQK